MKSFFLSLILSLVAGLAYAGPRVIGNGGDAVLCTDGQGRKTATLLDYYEAKTARNIQIDLGPASWSVEQKVKIAIDRMASIDPERAARYAHRIQTFRRDARFLRHYRLPDIPDSAHIMMKEGCHIEQVVIQRYPRPVGEPQFLVDQDIVDLMDRTQQAGLLIHEAIYEEALERHAVNSINTRYLNSKMASSMAAFADPIEANCLFMKLGLARIALGDNLYSGRCVDTSKE